MVLVLFNITIRSSVSCYWSFITCSHFIKQRPWCMQQCSTGPVLCRVKVNGCNTYSGKLLKENICGLIATHEIFKFIVNCKMFTSYNIAIDPQKFFFANESKWRKFLRIQSGAYEPLKAAKEHVTCMPSKYKFTRRIGRGYPCGNNHFQ